MAEDENSVIELKEERIEEGNPRFETGLAQEESGLLSIKGEVAEILPEKDIINVEDEAPVTEDIHQAILIEEEGPPLLNNLV